MNFGCTYLYHSFKIRHQHSAINFHQSFLLLSTLKLIDAVICGHLLWLITEFILLEELLFLQKFLVPLNREVDMHART